MEPSKEKSEITSLQNEFLASAHAHNFHHLGCLVTSFGVKLEYLHRNLGWTDTDPKMFA